MTTLTQPLEISILAAPLAAIDRRALSQAWYSALGYAPPAYHPERSEHPSRHPEPFDCASRAQDWLRRKAPESKDRCNPRWRSLDSARFTRCARDDKAHAARTAVAPSAASIAASVVERREGSKLAQHFERKLLLTQPFRGHASVAVAGGRVHLTLQRGERRLHIVALCPKRLEATVGRALAQARFALAHRGISAETLVKGDA